MPVSQTITRQLENASWIRRMFDEGARLKTLRGAENIFDYTLGNPDVDPPAAVLEELARAARDNRPGVHGYMSNAGYAEVREIVAAKVAAETGLPYTRDDILMTAGSSGASNVFLKSILDPADEVIVLMPCFSEYPFYVQNHAGTMVSVETGEDFLPDVDRIAAAITPRTRAIFLNSPNNPTGRVYPDRVLRDLESLLAGLDHPVTVVSDEPYKPILYGGRRAPSTAALITRTVIANSWSKSFAMAGERIGYLALSPRLPEVRELWNACTFANRILGFINAPAIWQRVIAAAIDAPVDVTGYERRCDVLCTALERIGYRLRRPEGTFYLFPESPLADDIAFVRLLAEEGVLGVPGTGFRRPGYFRLSFTVSMETIERSIPGFERAFARCS